MDLSSQLEPTEAEDSGFRIASSVFTSFKIRRNEKFFVQCPVFVLILMLGLQTEFFEHLFATYPLEVCYVLTSHKSLHNAYCIEALKSNINR